MSNTIMVRTEGEADDEDKNVGGRVTISISRKTHDELDGLGKRGETFDQIIQKCMQAYLREQYQQKGGKKLQ
jgi:predicted outer membrane protein